MFEEVPTVYDQDSSLDKCAPAYSPFVGIISSTLIGQLTSSRDVTHVLSILRLVFNVRHSWCHNGPVGGARVDALSAFDESFVRNRPTAVYGGVKVIISY